MSSFKRSLQRAFARLPQAEQLRINRCSGGRPKKASRKKMANLRAVRAITQ